MGREMSILFAQERAKVVTADINTETVNAVVDTITAEGGTAIATLTDVTKEEDVQNMIDEAIKTYKTLDILVNNAGIMDNFVPAEAVTDKLWEKVFAVNVTGAMRAIRKALPIFIEKKSGIIINIASVGGLLGCRAGYLIRHQSML